MAKVDLKPILPLDALRFFRSKGLVTSFAWQDVWQEEHARAFPVAKATTLDIVADIMEAIDKALVAGETLAMFTKDLRPRLEAKGWWGRKLMEDPLTGETKPVQLGSNRRLATIFDVNLRSAHAAGKWERIQATKTAFPFLRYVATGGKMGDGRTRVQHRAWHDTILPVGDAWWDTHYTPCGWRCRCTVQQLNARMMERRGLKVTTSVSRFPMKSYTNPRTGEVIRIEEGIDPGFNFNIGKAYMQGVTPSPSPPAAGEGRVASAAQRLPMDVDLAEASAAFLGVFGQAPDESKVFEDAAGWPLAIGPGLFRDAANRPAEPAPGARWMLPSAAEAVRDPDEIRWVPRRGQDGRPYMVRRYIRAELGSVVAVDFGARTWTYSGGPIETQLSGLLTEGQRVWLAQAA